MYYEEALGLVRFLISLGASREDAITNPMVPDEFRDRIRQQLEEEDIIILEPPGEISPSGIPDEWLSRSDRSNWYYWPTLRGYFLSTKNFPLNVVRSIDSTTDRILGRMPDPSTERFDSRGLVLGYIQSGKTANYTALIAKAADVGYRLIIVLSGIDNGLRRQTQIRLKRELVGYADGRAGSVPLPPPRYQWLEFTTEDINGDFQPGYATSTALQGPFPVLLVIKKNAQILRRRLLPWLDTTSEEVRRSTPLLVIDDEADQASIDTRGSYQGEGGITAEDYEPPTAINGLIRELLKKFDRSSYVAYTATPFANILIPHDTYDPDYLRDLYPKDFIFSLPKPYGYFGAEELFGIDSSNDEEVDGLDIVRVVPPQDLSSLDNGVLPGTMMIAIVDFILAGACHAYRGRSDKPATMLIHVSRLIEEQRRLAGLVDPYLTEIRDTWRYEQDGGIIDAFRRRWDEEFRPITEGIFPDRDVDFERIKPYIGPFLESVRVAVINSETGEVLDYERSPQLKAIAIGGDRLSRGLTLEGLLVSYFTRRSTMYDTLLQMGRWFGFRQGFEDITRIYTTAELASWFSDLAIVESNLRQDIKIYEDRGLTPYEAGMRIRQHPHLQVTGPLKRRYSNEMVYAQTYVAQRAQTFKFPFNQPDLHAAQQDANLITTRQFITRLGTRDLAGDEKGPIWANVEADLIVDYLRAFQVETESGLFNPRLICEYIERQVQNRELTRWTVAVRGRDSRNDCLGDADWGAPLGAIHMISRTKLTNTESLGVITSPGDEAVGLSEEGRERMQRYLAEGRKQDIAARKACSPQEGLLLLYPISRNSGYERTLTGSNRTRLYKDRNSPLAKDIIGLAISFPDSNNPQRVVSYVTGTAGWNDQ